MKIIKKHNLVILLAIFLYTTSIVLVLILFRGSKTDDYKYISNPIIPITANYSSNEELEIEALKLSSFEKRLSGLDSIYKHINNLYKIQLNLCRKGLGSKSTLSILEIEREIALRSINYTKRKQLVKISDVARAYIR